LKSELQVLEIVEAFRSLNYVFLKPKLERFDATQILRNQITTHFNML